MAKIKNLIFDLGGVLLNIDFNKTSQAFQQLGITQFDLLYSQTQADNLFEDLETGQLSEADFYNTLAVYCREGTSNEQMKNAWNALLLDFRKESLSYLKDLKKTYKIFLLSNTNSIHKTAFDEIFVKETGENSLDHYFITAYYSHLINKRKPYVETYRMVLDDAGIIAGETMFIDDSINNILGAKQAGLQTHHLLPGTFINDIPL